MFLKLMVILLFQLLERDSLRVERATFFVLALAPSLPMENRLLA